MDSGQTRRRANSGPKKLTLHSLRNSSGDHSRAIEFGRLNTESTKFVSANAFFSKSTNMSNDKTPTNVQSKSALRFVKAEVEKVIALDTVSYFAQRKERADLEAFKRILTREGGVAPRESDER